MASYEITISFPGDDWRQLTSRVDLTDREGIRGGVKARTKEQQLEDLCRSYGKRYKKYGGVVSWRLADQGGLQSDDGTNPR